MRDARGFDTTTGSDALGNCAVLETEGEWLPGGAEDWRKRS